MNLLLVLDMAASARGDEVAVQVGITNLIGNGVATVAIARWEGALDRDKMHRVLAGEPLHDPILADD